MLLHAVSVQMEGGADGSGACSWGGQRLPGLQPEKGALPHALLASLGGGDQGRAEEEEEGGAGGKGRAPAGVGGRGAGRPRAAGGYWKKKQNGDRGSKLVSFLVDWLGTQVYTP